MKDHKHLNVLGVAFAALLILTVIVNIAHSADVIYGIGDIHEPPRVEQMLDNMQDYVFFTVGSEGTETAAAGTGWVTFRMPFAFELLGVRADVTTAPSADMIIDINEAGTTVLGTKLYVQSGSTTSVDAYLSTSPTGSIYTITDADIADNALITIDIDSTTGGVDPKFTFYGRIKSLPDMMDNRAHRKY